MSVQGNAKPYNNSVTCPCDHKVRSRLLPPIRDSFRLIMQAMQRQTRPAGSRAAQSQCGRPSSIRPARCIIARSASATDSPLLDNIAFFNPSFKGVADEASFMAVMQGQVAAGRCPKQLMPLWQDFFANYQKAIVGSTQAGANEKLVAQVGPSGACQPMTWWW